MRQMLALSSNNVTFRKWAAQPLRVGILALLLSSPTFAQAPDANAHHPDQATGQKAKSAKKDQPNNQGAGGPNAASGARGMGSGMMMGPQGMMGSMMSPGGSMPANTYAMRMVFILADTNEDGALSFEEISAVHKRVFNRVDANKDGKVTIEEVQKFLSGN